MANPVKKKANKKRNRVKRPRHVARLRKATKRIARLLHEDPATIGKSMELLGKMLQKRQITIRTIYRILDAPLAHTTIKGKLRAFSKGKITFEKLIESVERAYASKVPDKAIQMVLNCRQGEFHEKVTRLKARYDAPRSLVTSLTISRMRKLKWPIEKIREAENIRWGIHNQSHKMYLAEQNGRKEAEMRARSKLKELEHAFTENFTKKL